MTSREELRQQIKNISLRFFYWWYNTKGMNTEEGFDTWAKTDEGTRLLALIEGQGKEPDTREVEERAEEVYPQRPMNDGYRETWDENESARKIWTEGYRAGDAARKEIADAEMQGLIEIHHEQAKELEEELIGTRLQLTSLKSVADKMAEALRLFPDVSSHEIDEALFAYETFCKENGKMKH